MKRYILLSVLVGALPLSMMAQDDLYFTPKKSAKQVQSSYEVLDDTPAYYSGSNRDVDEYNRQRPDKHIRDSIRREVEEEYAYTRRMSRFDDFYWYDPWVVSYYSPYWYDSWYGWYDPWYRPYWYGGWYRPYWYGGWYVGWYGGW